MHRILSTALLLAVAPVVGAQSLPPLPDSIYSPIGWVKVQRVPNLTCGDKAALGCFNGEHMTLAIRDSIPLNLAHQTLRHERLHLLLFLAGISLGNIEDHIADLLGAADVASMLHEKPPQLK